MTSIEEERVIAIIERAHVIYGLEGVNPIITDLLDQISCDVEWLCARLNLAWATAAAYKKELSKVKE